MTHLRDAIAAWSALGLRIAGATVVGCDGSTPHQRGLALVTNELGETAGALSGGCVDADVVLACDRVIAGDPGEMLVFGEADPDDLGAPGLVCGGSITVWVHEIGASAAELLASDDEGVIITRRAAGQIVQSALTPREALELECALPDGATGESGALQDARTRAATWLRHGQSRTELFSPAADEQVFFEAAGRHRLLVVVGSSGYTDALCAQARLLGYETVLIEPRPRFAAGVTLADEVIGSWPEAAFAKLVAADRINRDSAVIVCTHDSRFDEPALVAALETSAGFIGALGSRRTSADRLARLRDRGVAPDHVERIQSPVGLDLGGATAAETAVSIMAHIIANRSGRTGAPLRQTQGPLHAR